MVSLAACRVFWTLLAREGGRETQILDNEDGFSVAGPCSSLSPSSREPRLAACSFDPALSWIAVVGRLGPGLGPFLRPIFFEAGTDATAGSLTALFIKGKAEDSSSPFSAPPSVSGTPTTLFSDDALSIAVRLGSDESPRGREVEGTHAGVIWE